MMQHTASSLSYLSTGFSYMRNLEAKIFARLKEEDSSPFVRIRFWESPVSEKIGTVYRSCFFYVSVDDYSI